MDQTFHENILQKLFPLISSTCLLNNDYSLVSMNFEDEGIARDGLKIVRNLVEALKHYPSLIKPMIEEPYRDWVKVFDFSCQMFAGSEPGDLVHVYGMQCLSAWVKLGEAFGYFAEMQRRHQQITCVYDRCTGSDAVRGTEQLVCGECGRVGYCSARCQRA